MAVLVYTLCAFTSLICALLLYRSYRENRSRMAFWTALSFSLFFLNNLCLIFDQILFPHIDLALIRTVPLFAGSVLLVFGLIWDSV